MKCHRPEKEVLMHEISCVHSKVVASGHVIVIVKTVVTSHHLLHISLWYVEPVSILQDE